MRGAFIRGLVEIADRDPRVLLVTGDLGFTVIEPFADRYPERFFNAGVSEQNMVGLATGLAEAGFIPFVYSIATFASMRIISEDVLDHVIDGSGRFHPAESTADYYERQRLPL